MQQPIRAMNGTLNFKRSHPMSKMHQHAVEHHVQEHIEDRLFIVRTFGNSVSLQARVSCCASTSTWAGEVVTSKKDGCTSKQSSKAVFVSSGTPHVEHITL